MHYGSIKPLDVANGIGVRVTLFVSGCTNHCEHCFQPETWDFSYGNEFTAETEEQILNLLRPEYVHGLTLLGGEPFEPSNQRVLLPFLCRVKEKFPTKSIWAFSGFTLEELENEHHRVHCEATGGILSLIDVLVDGRYEHSKRNLMLRFRGSENQRLIDMRKTRDKGSVVLWDE